MRENDNTMNYRGLTASIHYGADDRVFWGKVLGVTDSITFHGESVEELIRMFHEAVDGYIEVASDIGRDVQADIKSEDERLYEVVGRSLQGVSDPSIEPSLKVVVLAVRSWMDKEGYEKSTDLINNAKEVKELKSIIKNGNILIVHHPACTESAEHPCNCGLTEYELRRIEMDRQ